MNNKEVFAVFAVMIIDGRVCATTRDSGIGLPGGKVDKGETPLQALRREAKEEGFVINTKKSRLVQDKDVDGRRVQWFTAEHVKTLTSFKEQYRGISPIVVSKEAIARSGFGNEFLGG